MLWILALALLAPVFRLAVYAEPGGDGAPQETKETAEKPWEPACPRLICANLEYDRVLMEKGADESCAPAAFTKLMTALLAFEYRRENGDVPVTVTREMLSGAGGTSIHLKEGEEIDFDSLLKGLVVGCANDAALVIASTVGGSVSAFVEEMNRRAEDLGMTGTYYNNPTGVDSAMMHTTLRDTLTLCRALYRVNDFMVLSSEERASIPATNVSAERVFTNKNALIPFSYASDYMVRGARGFIAGYTTMAGYCCASCRTADGATTLVLLSGGADMSEAKNGSQISSYRDAAKLLDWARDTFAVRDVIGKETILCERKVRLSGGMDHTILVAGSTLKALLPKDLDLKEAVRTEIRTEKEVLDAPVLKGTKYGEADFYYGDELLGTVDLVAQANVTLSRYLMIWDGVVRFFSTGPARVFLIIVISAAVLYLIVLVVSVYVHYLQNTRERRKVLREMEERENRRLREVRRQERKTARRNLTRARNAF
ncbi:MAG: D-alanyl-D-alanine carboxypeptidase, partial [Clostridia bacterium]|nr:D-alanyl-D-alanine carboxypeptidase [Clostridia bacterium]